MRAELIDDVDLAAQALRAGRLVAFATETVYGLGGNALDVEAVARIFAAKQRPTFDPLIVHLHQATEVEHLVREISPLARQLMERFWPGPLTLVLPKQDCVPDLVTAGLPSVAVRVPDHPQARELIRRSGVPVAAPSANPFGRISPTTAQHVLDSLGDQIDFVLDGGACRVGVESTVLQLDGDGPPRLLRPGGLSQETLEEITGPLTRAAPPQAHSPTGLPGPGMLDQHYAPRTPLFLFEAWDKVPPGPATGVLAFQSVPHPERFGMVEVLSPQGSLSEAAARFFAALRRLDAAPVTTIYAQPFPEEGLGRALNDRLIRAAR